MRVLAHVVSRRCLGHHIRNAPRYPMRLLKWLPLRQETPAPSLYPLSLFCVFCLTLPMCWAWTALLCLCVLDTLFTEEQV